MPEKEWEKWSIFTLGSLTLITKGVWQIINTAICHDVLSCDMVSILQPGRR